MHKVSPRAGKCASRPDAQKGLASRVYVVHKAPMTLAEYLKRAELKDAEFAKRCDCDRTTILRIRTGKTTPTPALMERIALETGGAVRPDDYFAGLPEAEAA
jgi:transcriptional regulator with XRE-family HTH domain